MNCWCWCCYIVGWSLSRVIFGMHSSGPDGALVLSHLCDYIHNVCMNEGVDYLSCPIIQGHPLATAIPSWPIIGIYIDMYSLYLFYLLLSQLSTFTNVN